VAKRTEENYRYAVAHAMETDVFIGLLLERLEAEGRLEDTVLIFYADHCNYYLLDNTLLKDIKGVDDLNQADNTDWFIYDGGKTTGTVDKVTSSLDVLPTIANLFGLDADYGAMIGHDAFSPDGGWAFWLDGCWFDGTQWSRQVREDIEQQKKMSQFILAGNYFAD
jgi:phosphoglycerol transferase MdoB-like AlkP superfamily enzyme